MMAQRLTFREGRTSGMPTRGNRVPFKPERPVLSFMEGLVSGEDNLDIRHELTVQILTQIRDSLDLIRRKQETMGTEMHTVSERVVRLEERNERLSRIEAESARVAGQIEVLIADKNKREGAIGAIEWVSKHWPFTLVSAAIMGFIAYANGLLGGKP